MAAVIRLALSGNLAHRDVALRVVSAACKLVAGEHVAAPLRRDFVDETISAFGEAFNNIALHGYEGRTDGIIEIEIDVGESWVTLRLKDHGTSFDPNTAACPDLEALPESGLGCYIMRAFMDRVSYIPGSPNILELTKYLHPSEADGSNPTR